MIEGQAIADRVASVRARIEAAARRAGRDPAAVTLVAATKTVPPSLIAGVVAAGVLEVGENRAQELLAKAPELASLPTPPHWHFLGALQRNKVRAVAPFLAWWHSVDRLVLGEEIARRAPGSAVLVEVNLGLEPQKAGCAPGDAAALVDTLVHLGLQVRGLMTVPPAAPTPQGRDPRRWFAQLRELSVELGVPELSMGMTDDFEIAVEEGATMVRVGRALFGDRREMRLNPDQPPV